MLSFSDLIITKNAEGIPTALGYPINSILLQQNKPLFMGGGGGTKCQTNNSSLFMNPERLAVPSGLVCMTQTVCRKADAIGANEIGANEMDYGAIDYGANAIGADEIGADEYGSQSQIIPEDLYEQLLALAETKPPKKLSRRKQPVHKVTKNNGAKNNGAKNKTKRKK